MQRVILNDGECNKEKHMVFLRLTVERLYGILANVAAEVKLTTLALELSLSLIYSTLIFVHHISRVRASEAGNNANKKCFGRILKTVASGKSRLCL